MIPFHSRQRRSRSVRERAIMRYPVVLENIEELRLSQDIDDVELRAEIQTLQVGDAVKLTFLNAKKASVGETLLVRITEIDGRFFHGKIAQKPASHDLPDLRSGEAITFTSN